MADSFSVSRSLQTQKDDKLWQTSGQPSRVPGIHRRRKQELETLSRERTEILQAYLSSQLAGKAGDPSAENFAASVSNTGSRPPAATRPSSRQSTFRHSQVSEYNSVADMGDFDDQAFFAKFEEEYGPLEGRLSNMYGNRPSSRGSVAGITPDVPGRIVPGDRETYGHSVSQGADSIPSVMGASENGSAPFAPPGIVERWPANSKVDSCRDAAIPPALSSSFLRRAKVERVQAK